MRDNNTLRDNTAKLPYRIVNELLYFNNDERGLRLYIPTSIEQEVFQLAYNKIGYPGYTRIYKRLIEGLYIFNIAIKLYEFIRYYPHY